MRVRPFSLSVVFGRWVSRGCDVGATAGTAFSRVDRFVTCGFTPAFRLAEAPCRLWQAPRGGLLCATDCTRDAVEVLSAGRVVRAMASQTVGFALADEDRERLDRLVEYFGGGNRSAYLRATFKVMESLRRAERLRDLQANNHRRLAEQGIAADDLPELIRQAYKESQE
jgi:hypothetical protein